MSLATMVECSLIKVRVRTNKSQEPTGTQPEWLVRNKENIVTVHEPKAHTAHGNALGTGEPCYEAFPLSKNPVIDGA